MPNSDFVNIRTWYDGDFSGNIGNVIWRNGNFKDGRMEDFTWLKGKAENVKFRNGYIANGNIKNCSTQNVKITEGVEVEGTKINSGRAIRCKATSCEFLGTIVENGEVYNSRLEDVTAVNGGIFLDCSFISGKFKGFQWKGGWWYSEEVDSWLSRDEVWEDGYILDMLPLKEFDEYYKLERDSDGFAFTTMSPRQYWNRKDAFEEAKKKGVFEKNNWFVCWVCGNVLDKKHLWEDEKDLCFICAKNMGKDKEPTPEATIVRGKKHSTLEEMLFGSKLRPVDDAELEF